MKILVTGAGGFIGHHLVNRLKSDGHFVRGVDIKYPKYAPTQADEFLIRDLRTTWGCADAVEHMEQVYNLAADMGGIGYITAHLASIARNNILINANMLEAARIQAVNHYLYTSSACVYNQDKQMDADVTPLKEEDAYPALPEPGYGWEKLFAEEMTNYYAKDYGLDTRIVRFHNVYGPLGTYDGGKEKSPAAICRKVALSTDNTIEVWGDGKQTRSYMYIDDCVEGLIRIMASGCQLPLNLGTDELVTIDGLVALVAGIAHKPIFKIHDTTKPQGVRGRNSDNTRLRTVLGWEPQTLLNEGLVPTYAWIKSQVIR
jgi:GDP-D-mannose 3', 5'-epimerase